MSSGEASTVSSSASAPASHSSPSASSSSPNGSSASPSGEEGIALFNRALSKLLENSLVEVMEALDTLLVYTKNLILFPDEKKYRKIKISNIHYQERLGHLNGALEAMTAIGYVPQGDYLRLDEKKMKTPGNEEVLKQLEDLVSQKLVEVKKGWGNLPLRSDSAVKFSSVTAAGSYSAIGKRHNMEDDEIIVDKYCGDEKQGYFGLYDGHGGRATVDFVVKALHMNLEQHLKRFPEEALPEAFKQSYLATDGQLRRQNILRSGTTSVTCVVRQVGSKRMLFTANVGDSRAVLARGGKAVRLTIDHKASLPEEAKRITDAGGFIGRNKRVNGVLAISRALGDHMLKENDVVSAEPYCIAENAAITTAEGETVRIQDFCPDSHSLLVANEKSARLSFAPAARKLIKGKKECVELAFLDGRTLTCTADHRVLTQNGWKHAEDLVPERDAVLSGPWAPVEEENPAESAVERQFSFEFGSSEVSLAASRSQALAISRLAGLLLSRGFSDISSLSGRVFLRFTHVLDAERFLADLELANPEFSRRSADIQSGLRVEFDSSALLPFASLLRCDAAQFPSHFLSPDAPRVWKREFLAGFIGSAISSIEVSEKRGVLLQLLRSASVSPSPAALIDLLNSLLSTSVSSSSSSSSLSFSPRDFTQFSHRIGTRYAHSQSGAIGIAASWGFASEKAAKQRKMIIELARNRVDQGDSAEEAVEKAIAALQAEEILLPFAGVLPSPADVLSGSSPSLRPLVEFRDFLQSIDGSSFFTSSASNTFTSSSSRSSSRSSSSSSLPTFRLPFLGSRSAGLLNTYDLMVPGPQNFFANGLCVHNCSDTELTSEDTHILLACDGVWDVMTDQEAIDLMLEKVKHYTKIYEEKKADGSVDKVLAEQAAAAASGSPQPKRDESMDIPYDEDTSAHNPPLGEFPCNHNEVMRFVAKSLVREALDRRSLDNVTVMIIEL